MSENTPEYSIAEHYDPDREMSPNTDPLSAYLTYVADVRGRDYPSPRLNNTHLKAAG